MIPLSPRRGVTGSMLSYKPILCVVGALLINLTLGTFYSIGNVLPYLASYMRDNGNPNVTTEHGTWITATYLLGQGTFIIIGSYIEQSFSSRVACIFGCILHCFSTYMTMWAINVNITIVILVYGFGSGVGCGSAYMASIIAAQKWYPASKGILTGVIVAGFGFGGLIFTNLQTWYINPNNIAPNESTGYFSSEVHSKVPTLFLYMGIIFTVAQTVGCLLAFPPPTSPAECSAQQSPTPSAGQGQPATTIYNDDTLPAIRNSMSAFNYKIFYIIGLMMMLVAPGVIFVNSLGKRFGQSFISDDRYLATVVAVAAVANATGRLTWGYLSDKFSFSTCFAMKVTLFSALIITFPFEFVLSSKVCYLIWMLGLFFGFSGTFVLFPVFVEQVFGARYHGFIYGFLYIFLAASSIATSFVIQMTVGSALADQRKTPDEKFHIRLWPCLMIAITYVLSIAIYYLSLPTRRLETAIRRKKELELARARTGLVNRPDLFSLEHGLVNRDINGQEAIQRENSLGSIVRFAEGNPNEHRIKTLNKNPWV